MLSALASFGLVFGLAGASFPAAADHSELPDGGAAFGTEVGAEVAEAAAGVEVTSPATADDEADPGAERASDEHEQVDDGAAASASPTETTDDTPGDDGADAGTPRGADEVDESRTVSARGRAFTPAAAGPDGAAPPYVHWTVEDVAGNLVGGATFDIAGPATSHWFWGMRWGSASTVHDCVSSPCAGPDLDPDPGEFLVKMSGSAAITDGGRYRVQPTSAPGGYRWTGSTEWVELPGSGATPDGGAWQNRTYDFGTFPVRQLGQYAPACAAGAIYGLSANGFIREVSASESVADLGARAGSVSSFNGLGIGYGGETVYAYERTSSQSNRVDIAAIWSFNTNTGRWSSMNRTINSNGEGRRVGFVAGAVDLDTGKYYLGGFNSNGTLFRIWEYDPGTNSTSYKGEINTSSGSGGANNGDMAFNATGDLFVVRGSGATTTVFSVTGQNLQAASGGTIPSSRSANFTTMDNVNGIAFDADGKGYLGSESGLRSYDMPGWTNGTTVVSSGLNSTDLASCSSPPTITLEKYVEGDRVDARDQFRLELRQGGTRLGEETTSGNQSGLQDERVGPLPTVRNVELAFSETAAGTTDFANYVASYTCTLDDEPWTSGQGTNGTVTIPSNGQDVVCTFRNAPLIANVTLYKFMADHDGEDPVPHPGWTVGMDAAPTAGSIRDTAPAATTQTTGAEGQAAWTIRFADHSDRATITVSEEMQGGYELAEDAVCSVNGTEITFSGTSHAIPGVAPGDDIHCAFTNKPRPASITLTKDVGNDYGGTLTATDWDGALFADADGAPRLVFDSGQTRDVIPGTYALTEAPQPGYELVDLTCDGGTFDPTTGRVTVGNGDTADCTFTNRDLPGSVTWTKVVAGADDLRLAGSEWELTHPDGSTTVIVDCVTDGTEECQGMDRDPAAGRFHLVDLAWGEYRLVETKAPPGYVRETTPYTFTVTANELDLVVGAITNVQHEGPALPLTGGLGRDHVYLGGGLALLLSLTIFGAMKLHQRRHPQSAA